MKNVLLVTVSLVLLLAACKKNEDGPSTPAGVSRTQLLTRGKWLTTVSTITVNLGTDTTIDLFALYDTCQKDDYTIFRADNHLIADEGTVKCNASSPQQSENGTWALTSHDSTIILTGGSPGGTFKIVALDSNILQVTADTTFFTLPGKFRATYTHVN